MDSCHVENGVLEGEHRKEVLKVKAKGKIEMLSNILFVLALLTVFLAVGDTQVSVKLYRKKEVLRILRKNFSSSTNYLELSRISPSLLTLELVLKSVISFISLLMCVLLYLLYKKMLEYDILRCWYPPKLSLLSATDLLTTMMLEIVICAIHVPPLSTLYLGISYKVQVIVFLRTYLVARFLRHRHQFMRSKLSRFLSSVTQTEMTMMFLLRTYFMQHPFYTVICGYLFVFFTGGYVVWLIEDFRLTYLNVLWMIVITSTTVGYGDLTPKTGLAKACMGFISLYGIVIFATTVQSVNNYLQLSMKEKRILQYVVRQENQLQKKIAALNAIGTWYKYHSFKKIHFLWMPTSERSILTGNHQVVQMQIINRIKAQLLKRRMLTSIHLWRRTKIQDERYNYKHEFMIGDINTMVSQLVSDIGILINEKGRGSKNSQWKINELSKSTPSIGNYREKELQNVIEDLDMNISDEKRLSPFRAYNFQDSGLSQEIYNGIQMIPISRENERNIQVLPASSHNSLDDDLTVELHSERISNYHSSLLLLENQTVIMKKKLEDSYRKIQDEYLNTYCKLKKDVNDLHNIIRSLECLLERETSV